jgi:hypothetical protein
MNVEATECDTDENRWGCLSVSQNLLGNLLELGNFVKEI